MTDHPPFRSWLRATALGWLLGIPLLVILALIGESLGVGGTQVLVGLGMGIGVGIMQGRRIATWLPIGRAWRYVTPLALALPFLATDLGNLLDLDFPYSLPVAVAIGGLLTGLAQTRLLRPHVTNAALWVPASLIGWSLAGAVASLGDVVVKNSAVRGIAGALLYLGLAAGGGVVLGVVTAFAIGKLVRREGRGERG